MEFVMTDEQVKKALLANGWRTHWGDENWVHVSRGDVNEYAGCSTQAAFLELLREKNIIDVYV